MQVSELEVLERWGIDADIQIVFVHAGVPSGKQPWACDKIYQKGQLCTSKCDSVVRCLLRNVNSYLMLHFWLISGGYFTRKHVMDVTVSPNTILFTNISFILTHSCTALCNVKICKENATKVSFWGKLKKTKNVYLQFCKRLSTV